MASDERRIIVIGKTGNGKSSTANTVLGKEAFVCKQSLNPVTKSCQKHENYNELARMKVVIVDTPGIFDAGTTLAERALEIQHSVDICPRPHAFLLVFSTRSRFTQEDQYTIDVMRVIFGDIFFKHCIVVFTNGDDLKNDEAFRMFWNDSVFFKALGERCKNRIIGVENSGPIKDGRRIMSAGHIFEVINQMSDHGRKTYDYASIMHHRQALMEHIQSYHGSREIGTELNSLSLLVGKKLKDEFWDTILVGTKIAGSFVGGVGSGVGAAVAIALTLAGKQSK